MDPNHHRLQFRLPRGVGEHIQDEAVFLALDEAQNGIYLEDLNVYDKAKRRAKQTSLVGMLWFPCLP